MWLFLTDELRTLEVMTRSDELVSLAAIPGSDSLVGKRVQVACTVESNRENYYYEDGSYDRVFLAPEGEAVEVDIWKYSAEDRKRQKEMFQRRKATIVNFDDRLNELA
jgi:hypothetical protein